MADQSTAGFILAAGESRRLRPASLVRPKALMPFCGVPMIELAAAQLIDAGAGTVVVNAWHLADQVSDAASELRESRGWNVLVSQEAELLGTGGGLREGAKLVPEARRLLVHNADVVLDFSLRELLDEHEKAGAAATILLVPGRGPCTIVADAPATGDTGYLYVLVLDGTFTAVGQAEGRGTSGNYDFLFNGATAGSYYLVAGTDQNDDGFICDDGEACGAWPTVGTATPVVVGANVSGLDFTVAFGTGAGIQSAVPGTAWPAQGFRRLDRAQPHLRGSLEP